MLTMDTAVRRRSICADASAGHVKPISYMCDWLVKLGDTIGAENTRSLADLIPGAGFTLSNVLVILDGGVGAVDSLRTEHGAYIFAHSSAGNNGTKGLSRRRVCRNRYIAGRGSGVRIRTISMLHLR